MSADPGADAAGRSAGRGALVPALIVTCYVLAAVAVTWRLWADPASQMVAGNPHDADLFAWFLRYDATAVAHGRLPALITTAMNPPQGINIMWNTSLLLPGVLLAPVTLLLGPQVSLTVLTTVGFAGSAASLFFVLRRWNASAGASALGAAVYGFSPALLHSAIGHYNLQLALLPPLIIDAGLRLCIRSRNPVRAGAYLGLLVTAQIFTGEELLVCTAIAGLLLVTVLVAGQPRTALRRCGTAAAGLAVATAVVLLLAGLALTAQFLGPLRQHGSAFTPDFFKNDLTGFVAPSRYLLFHTAASAVAAGRFQGGVPEYLAYLGWPLLAALAIAAIAFWRRPAIRACAVTFAVLELLSLGGHPLIGGVLHPGVSLPWHWIEGIPVLGNVLPDRLSILADGLAAALLAFSLDLARARLALARRGAPVRLPAVLCALVAAVTVLPLAPRPLSAASATPVPAGWSAALVALRLPPGARVLVVPVPTATLTAALRWQAESGAPASLIGGYFQGPAWNGQVYVDGNGVAVTAQYLDRLWAGGPATPGPARSQVRADLANWRPAAVIAVASPNSAVGHYLSAIFGPPGIRAGQVLGWRL